MTESQANAPAPRELTIVSLFPRDMNIYGDSGNVLALERRARAHGFGPRVVEVNRAADFPEAPDLIIGGGGQDSGQDRVVAELAELGPRLRELADGGTPMLLICGLYQLFGHRFVTNTGRELPGIGVLDVETRGTEERLIGNVVLDSAEFGEVIGYENHSGYTTLGPDATPLGTVTLGSGNDATSGAEGARRDAVIGSYLHGSLLPKNPAISDFLIGRAAERRYGSFAPAAIDDTTAERARASAKRRPR